MHFLVNTLFELGVENHIYLFLAKFWFKDLLVIREVTPLVSLLAFPAKQWVLFMIAGVFCEQKDGE